MQKECLHAKRWTRARNSKQQEYMNVALLPQVFERLLGSIVDEATRVLRQEKILDQNEAISLGNKRNQTFGTDTRDFRKHLRAAPAPPIPMAHRKTIAYAVYEKMFAHNPQTWQGKLRSFEQLSPRVLSDAYKAYDDWSKNRRNTEAFIPFNANYLELYLAFIGFSKLEDFLAQAGLEDKHLERQKSLLGDAPQADYEEMYYHCHHLDLEAWSKDKTKKLSSFQATFTIKGKSTHVHFTKTPSGETYTGEVRIVGRGREALITAFSEGRKGFPRPIAVVLYQNQNTAFKELAVSVGFYVYINRSASCVQGVVVFEKIEHLGQPSQLDPDLLCAFLAGQGDEIEDGCYVTLRQFKRELEHYRPKLEEAAFVKRLQGICYQAIILSKKGRHDSRHEQFNRIETAYFHFGPGDQLECHSDYPGGPMTYGGHTEYFPPNKAIFHLHHQGSLPGQYQIIIDLPSSHDLHSFDGVYSGITQDGHIAAGRVRFIKVDPENHPALPGVYDLHSEPAQALLKQYEKLRDFFMGNEDNYLDNPAIFYENPLMLAINDSNVLEGLPGTFYYYRTRTIKGHVREIKRYPLLIKADGNVTVKVKADGEEFTASGKAIRKHDRVYMHLNKKDKYDGLAILYPRWGRLGLGETEEDIKAVYASTSKSGHLMAGRMFLRRLSDDTSGEHFKHLQPDNIDIDRAHERADVDPSELPIIRRLAGQLNNYIAVRYANEEVEPYLGQRLFESACFLAGQQNHQLALRVLLLAVMQGGFADIKQLRQALSEHGHLAAIKASFLQAPIERFGPDVDPIGDQREYLQAIIARLQAS
jgi:membrane-bound inhibitor of C-type lysozyme